MENFIANIISVILGYLTSKIAGREKKGFLFDLIALIAVSLFATILYFGYFYIQAISREETKLEGSWIETYEENGSPRYGIATFKYNPIGGSLEFTGFGYNPAGDVVGHWKTLRARYDKPEFSYLFEGRSWNPDRPGERKGVGSILFENNNSGTGYFFSVSTDKILRNFKIKKITDEAAKKESQENADVFIKKLYSDPAYMDQVTARK